MGFLFSKKKKKPVKLESDEQAILKCKMTRDNIKKYIKNLERNANLKKENAKKELQAKNRDKARLHLRMEKMFREQIKVAEGQLNMIEEQISQIETAVSQKDVMTVLQEGNAALKKLQEEVNIEKLEKIKDEMDDLKEKNDEISEFFKERGIDDTEDVDDELNKLIATVQQEAEGELPRANKEILEEEKENEMEEEKNKKVAVEA